MRTQTYLFLQKLKCPKCGRILAGEATHKVKNDKWYFYYRCEDCKNNIKEKKIEEAIMHILNDVFEYDSVVNEFFLPVLKNKLENPKDELEEEIKKLNNKKKRLKEEFVNELFTKESLIRLQDKMRTLCIEEFNEEYSLDSTLKKKQKGRNRDIHVSDMDNYIEMKKQLKKNTGNLKQANKKSSELKHNSKEIKDKIDKLKISKLNKDNCILTKEDKDSFIDFINQVDNTNKEYDKIQNLSNTLVNVDEQLKDKNKKIKTLTENNEALSLRVKTLNETIKSKDNEISFLKSKINNLRDTLDFWKDKFSKLISFLHSKLHNWYDKYYKYIDVVNDMYEDEVLDDDDIEDLDFNKEKNDDLER